MKNTILILALTILASCACAETAEYRGNLASVTVETNGGDVRVACKDGNTFFSAPIGEEYSIIVRNRTGKRIVAIATVDGLNVIDRSKGDWEGSGYVIDPYDKVEITGFRRQDEFQYTERFTFNKAQFSLANRIGNVRNVGVIGVAVFEEYVPPPPVYHNEISLNSCKESMDKAHACGEESATPSSTARRSKSARAGTEAGRTVNDPVRRVTFQRASDTPAEILALYYDTESNLIASGILPPPYDPPPTGFLSPFPQNYAKGSF